MRKHIFLLFWLTGILFPVGWLGNYWSDYARIYQAFFEPLWVHVVMHAGLFAVLAGVLWILSGRRTTPRAIGLLLSLVALVGIGQEAFQALSRNQIYWNDSLFDLGVDLSGAVIGLTMTWRLRRPGLQPAGFR